jgi:hypothetical protein
VPAGALKLTLTAAISGYVRGANDISPPEQSLDLAQRVALALGTAANQADLFFADSRSLAASATETLDLAGGLVDGFGATITFVEIVGVLIAAKASNTNDVVVGGAAANGWAGFFADVTDKLVLKPGAFAFIAAGANPAYPVVAGTGDQLQVANSGAGTGVDYDIILIGRSA